MILLCNTSPGDGLLQTRTKLSYYLTRAMIHPLDLHDPITVMESPKRDHAHVHLQSTCARTLHGLVLHTKSDIKTKP